MTQFRFYHAALNPSAAWPFPAQEPCDQDLDTRPMEELADEHIPSEEFDPLTQALLDGLMEARAEVGATALALEKLIRFGQELRQRSLGVVPGVLTDAVADRVRALEIQLSFTLAQDAVLAAIEAGLAFGEHSVETRTAALQAEALISAAEFRAQSS